MKRWLDPAFFTDEKLAKATLPERHLFAAMIANQDDDGRLLAHPGYLRSIAFPYDDFTIEQVAQMRDHLAEVNRNVIVYQNGGNDYIQLRRHSRYQKPRYYRPSKFPAPPGWPFEQEPLKNDYNVGVEKERQYHIANTLRAGKWLPTDEEIKSVEINKRLGNLYADIFATTASNVYILIEVKQYPLQFRDLGQIKDYRSEAEARGYIPIVAFLVGNGLGNLKIDDALSAQVTPLNLDLNPIESVTPTSADVAPTTAVVEQTMVTTGVGVGVGEGKGKYLGKGMGMGEGVGQTHAQTLSHSWNSISQALKDNFPLAFGREPTSREKAYLRDIEKKIVPAGATAVQVYDAYQEAARHNKQDLSYVRAILFDWLGISRAPPKGVK